MTFFDSIKTVFRKYATFDGRATRPEFWWFILFSTLVSAALNAVAVPIGFRLPGSMMSGDYGFGYGSPDYGTMFASGMSTFSLAGLWGVAVLLPTLAVAVRRLRDAGRGWAELFWLLLPIAGIIILIVHLCDRSVAAPAAPTPVVDTVTSGKS